jgi:hypothetical protein
MADRSPPTAAAFSSFSVGKRIADECEGEDFREGRIRTN